jgi:ubiquinone/menaquinone biosynthesis C-methylase UbiE
MTIPDWQLPPGVDRGLWDYLHATEMVAGYDQEMRASLLAEADVTFCEKAFPTPGRLVDLGCGTGRLCIHFARKGYECVGVDLSEEMLSKARDNWESVNQQASVSFVKANLVELTEFLSASFDYAACLFSTLGMVRGEENRGKVIANAYRLLKPGGHFVLHVHNRYFLGLGSKRLAAQVAKTLFGLGGDITMPQAYGGAPLTLHHFAKSEAMRLLEASGFIVQNVLAIGTFGREAWPVWRVYGWMIMCERPQ